MGSARLTRLLSVPDGRWLRRRFENIAQPRRSHGDYATITVALFDRDPLQAAVDTILRNMVHAPYIMRRLPGMVIRASFTTSKLEPHGYIQTTSPDYLLSLISRSVVIAVKEGEFGEPLAEGFVSEAKRRVENGSFYGAIMFLSLTAEKPEM